MSSDLDTIEIEPIYEEMMYTFLHADSSELNENLEVSTLFDYIQEIFLVDNNFHKQMLDLAHHRNPPILRLAVKCTEAKYLRSSSPTGNGNYIVHIFKTSSPGQVNTTQVQINSSNPKWADSFIVPITESDKDEIVFEMFDCCPDILDLNQTDSKESESVSGIKFLLKELKQSGSKCKKLVGRATIPMQSIKPDGVDVWLQLNKHGKQNNRGMINVHVNYCAEKPRDLAMEDYQCLVHHILLYELKASRVADHWWNGKFSEPGEAILRTYLSRVHLSQIDIAISNWAAFSKVHIKKPLSFILFDSLLNKFSKSLDSSISDTDMKYIWEGAARLLPSCFIQIQNQIANKTYDATLKIVLNILAKLEDLVSRTTRSNDVFNFSIFKALENAVIDGANEWFDKQLDELNIVQIMELENVSNIKDFIHLLKTDLSQAMQLDEIIIAKNNIRFAETLFLVYDEKLGYIVENILTKSDNDWQMLHYAVEQTDTVEHTQEKNITVALFELYLTLKDLLALGTKITVERDSFKLSRCQFWFSGALTHWLEFGVEKALVRIEAAVVKDNFEPEHEDARYSSSAIDTLGIFYQVKYIWDQLEWADDVESLMIVEKIIYDICRLCSFYANKIHSTLVRLHMNHHNITEQFQVIEQWCLAINNMEFIRAKINTFTSEIRIKHTVNRISNLYNTAEGERAAGTFHNIIEYINDIKDRTILQSIEQIIRHLSSIVRSNLTTVIKSQNFESQSIDDLLEYIDKSMYTLRNDLNSINFEKTVELFWPEFINILEDIITLAVQNRNGPQFYSNLQHFFYKIVYIVTTVEPTNPNFMKGCPTLFNIDNRIRLNSLETPSLIQQYYLVRAQSQNEMFNAKNATLTVRCHFKENDLIIEILNARNLEKVLPRHNVKCNPFVKIQILSLNQHYDEYTTKLVKNTIVPLFEENHLIKIQPDDRLRVDSLILFTLWNRCTVFKTDEFMGECYIALQDVANSFIEKQTHLNLTISSDVSKTELEILETRRRYDKEVQVFLRNISKRNYQIPGFIRKLSGC